ncbi:MAG TPA: alpha/beta hydrolase [Methylotenera sp.]|nr:alpha/beta hydrolase [Methylotenera sp.]
MNLKKIILPVSIIGVLGFTSLIYAAQKMPNDKTQPNKADPEMQKVLDALASLHPKPIPQLTPQEARQQPTPADAVMKVLKDEGKSTEPLPVASIKDISIPGPHGEFPAHVYTPKGAGPFPLIVYFHGGGFVIASTKVYEASVRGLANGAEAIVVAVDYHLAPEHKYPTQPDEAYAAYTWVLKHAADFNGDPKRVAVAGESAGGNLAAVVSLMARDKNEPMPIHELLVYPVVDNKMNNASYIKNANAKPLDKPMMAWFFKHYAKQKSDAENAYALPNKAKSLKGLPPTTLITAEIDPLYSEGKAFAERLKSENVPVAYKHYDGVTHEFFGMAAVVSKAKDAQEFASAELKKAFNTK